MSRIIIVPNALSDAINEQLDAAYLSCPGAAIDREQHYQIMLNYFDEHGTLPEFELKKKEPEK